MKSFYRLAIVIPCYNEQSRLQKRNFEEFSASPECYLIFVDDGSTDNTVAKINSFSFDSEKFEVLHLRKNLGKSNAMGKGFQRALDLGFDFIGTYDADGAVDQKDIFEAFKICSSNQKVNVVSGARILLAGSNVRRKPIRKWLGRVIATIVAFTLQLQIYDPQSPCKVYRSKNLEGVLKEKFKTRWFFDAEVLMRLKNSLGNENFNLIEFPITEWDDVEDSHLSLLSGFRVFLEILYLKFSNQK